MSGKQDKNKGLHSEGVITKMQLLQNESMEEFAEYVFNTMCKFEDDVLNDGEELEDKLKAINLLLDYFQEKEDYMKCARLRDFLKDLNEAK